MDEILAELKKINASIMYQTKLFEELFLKKDESQSMMAQKQVMLRNFIDSVSAQLQSKGLKTTPFDGIVNSLNAMIGDVKNEHKIS